MMEDNELRREQRNWKNLHGADRLLRGRDLVTPRGDVDDEAVADDDEAAADDDEATEDAAAIEGTGAVESDGGRKILGISMYV